MSNLDTLRKQYELLTPFERAVMASEAVERKDEATVAALVPPTLWDAFHEMGNKLAFTILAFTAVHESQKGETQYWLAMTMVGVIDRQKASEGDKQKCDAKRDEWIDRLRDGERRSKAWLLALEALDTETGGACMPFARTFAGWHVECILSREYAEEMDYSAELDYLREMWNASMKGSPEYRPTPQH